MRRFFLACVALYAGAVLVCAPLLPARVPVHFGLDSRANQFGGRTGVIVFEAALGIGMAALFLGLVAMIRRAPLSTVNVPHADYWKHPDRSAELRRRIAADLLGIGASTVLLMAVLVALVTKAAVDGSGRLSPAATVALVGYLVFVVGWTVYLTTWRYRPEPA